eukprot:scaffold80060_cov75-Phaeocystis_antarctica.AAC.2
MELAQRHNRPNPHSPLPAVAIMPPSTKGVAKKNLKERAKIPSSERLDNNVAIILKHLGHKRTKERTRGIKDAWILLESDFEKLDLPSLDSRFTKVYQELQSLNNQAPNIKRAAYTGEFKSCLAWMAKGAGGFFNTPNKEKEELVSAVEAALAHEGFAALDNLPFLFNFKNGLDEDGSATTEDTASWSVTTEDTVLVNHDDYNNLADVLDPSRVSLDSFLSSLQTEQAAIHNLADLKADFNDLDDVLDPSVFLDSLLSRF